MERKDFGQHSPEFKEKPESKLQNEHNESRNQTESAPKFRLTNSDVFTYVVEIAIAAKRAEQHANEAGKRAQYVAELAKRARAEAVSMAEVAEGLARTAASVGRVSLEICHFRSFQEAYQNNPKLSQKMDFNEFSAIVQPSFPQEHYRESDRDRYPYCDSLYYDEFFNDHQNRLTNHERRDYRYHESGKSESAKFQHDMSNHKRGEYVDSRNPFIEKQGDRESHRGPVTMSEYIVRDPIYKTHTTNGTMHQQPERPKANYIPPPSAFFQPAKVSSGNSVHGSSEKFVERFPTQLSPVEYKDSLANTFDTCQENMPPLWENRYCEPESQAPKQAPKPVQGQTEKWSDKKTMKQFQIKLNKYGIEDEDGQLGGARKNDETRPEDQYHHGMGGFASSIDDKRIQSNSSCPILPLGEITVNYDSENESSDDSEVINITSEISHQQTIQKLLTQEASEDSAGQRLPPRNKQERRPISPLLSEQEREHFSMSGDEDINSPNTKQIYVPAKHVTNDNLGTIGQDQSSHGASL